MVAIHVRTQKAPPHEPENRNIDLQRLTILRFMGSMHGGHAKGTLHEPDRGPNRQSILSVKSVKIP